MSSQTLELISYIIISLIVVGWLAWVSYSLYNIQSEPSDSSKDLPKILKTELTSLFSPNSQTPNTLKTSWVNIETRLASIANNNKENAVQLSDLLSKINASLALLASQNSLYQAQKSALSEKETEILKLKEELQSIKTSLSDSQKNYEKKVQETEEIIALHSVKLSQKDAEHASLVHSIQESNLKDLEKNKTIIDKHTELHIPAFIKRTLEQDILKLYEDVISEHSEAISLWTSLGSFKSSCREGASPEFTLQVLKQLGLDVVKYYASSENSNPEFTHQKLSQWADCLNANSNDRFSLFIPALGASINNSLMQSVSGSAYTVTEVLGWGIRNPNGIVYSTALFR